LDQILPWLFYHKVVGVAQFLLFVEGRAAKPQVAGVLESIPVGIFFSLFQGQILRLIFCSWGRRE
jgi:hypothetical protein